VEGTFIACQGCSISIAGQCSRRADEVAAVQAVKPSATAGASPLPACMTGGRTDIWQAQSAQDGICHRVQQDVPCEYDPKRRSRAVWLQSHDCTS
jgi:hypothetical protein